MVHHHITACLGCVNPWLRGGDSDERAEHLVSCRSVAAEQPSAEQAVPESKVSSLSDGLTGADEVKTQHISELMIGAGKHLRAKEHQEAKQVWKHATLTPFC